MEGLGGGKGTSSFYLIRHTLQSHSPSWRSLPFVSSGGTLLVGETTGLGQDLVCLHAWAVVRLAGREERCHGLHVTY